MASMWLNSVYFLMDVRVGSCFAPFLEVWGTFLTKKKRKIQGPNHHLLKSSWTVWDINPNLNFKLKFDFNLD